MVSIDAEAFSPKDLDVLPHRVWKQEFLKTMNFDLFILNFDKK